MVCTDSQGRSGVSTAIERAGVPEAEAVHEIFAGHLMRTAPPGVPHEFLDISPGAGAALWRIFEFPPGLTYDMHHTDTVDFDVVIEGSMSLELDRDTVELGPGDAVLLRGDRHAWRAGPDGCRMLIALLGVVHSSSDKGDEASGDGRSDEPDRRAATSRST